MKKYLFIVIRVVIAVILLQTLRFKFTAHPESVYIFEKVGMEPIGRIGSGIAELLASILLFVPGRVWLGALITVGVIGGAIVMHLTILGIEVRGDEGTLFYMAILTFVLALATLWNYRKDVPFIKT